MAQKISSQLGLGVGISGGANFIGTVLSDDNTISIFPDDNKKYISTDLVSNYSSKLVDNIELIDYEVM
jgi:cysteine synthase A